MPHRVEIPVHWCEHVQAVKFGDSPVLNKTVLTFQRFSVKPFLQYFI